MNIQHIPALCLDLFDGQAPGGEALGETQATPGPTHRGTTSGAEPLPSGRQPDRAQSPAAGEKSSGEQSSPELPPQDRRQAFLELVNGPYKDIYTQETQRIIDRRFKQTRNLERQLERTQPILDRLMERYQIPDGDLDRLRAALEREGKPEPRQSPALGIQAAQRQLASWDSQAGELRQLYPHFDLRAQAENPRFLALLRSGVPLRQAYEVLHMEHIKADVAQQAQKQVVDGIRAKGIRPQENGTAAHSAFTVKDDVSKLTRADREEIARRAQRGEKISF